MYACAELDGHDYKSGHFFPIHLLCRKTIKNLLMMCFANGTNVRFIVLFNVIQEVSLMVPHWNVRTHFV